jgi:glutaminyl-peptide cyclotransferase
LAATPTTAKRPVSDKPRIILEPAVRVPSGQTVFLWLVVAASSVLIGYLVATGDNGWAGNRAQPVEPQDAGKPARAKTRLNEIPFDGEQAYEYLKQICALGPRFSGSTGMAQQQKLLVAHFEKQGGKVRMQEFRVRHPLTGRPVEMANIIVEWHPERKERVLLCAHYDTRPYPDQDRRNPRGRFIGANDGASGVALLMEMGVHMKALKGNVGVDFVLFDGEELVYREGDPYFYGSERFATTYAESPPAHRYRWGVLLDMVGGKDLQLFQEGHSVAWADTRPLVGEIWGLAARLGVREFIPQVRHQVLDDHIKLHDIAKIPTCDIIDFDYPAWHTEDDVPANCSALSLAKVGWVVEEWLKQAVRK